MLLFRDQVYEVANSVLQNLVASRKSLAGRSRSDFVCSAEEGLGQFSQFVDDIQKELQRRGLAIRFGADDLEAPKVFVHKTISRDAVASPVEKTYQVMIFEFIGSSGSEVCPLSTQIVWGNKTTFSSGVSTASDGEFMGLPNYKLSLIRRSVAHDPAKRKQKSLG
jgi:hypothetical protein